MSSLLWLEPCALAPRPSPPWAHKEGVPAVAAALCPGPLPVPAVGPQGGRPGPVVPH